MRVECPRAVWWIRTRTLSPASRTSSTSTFHSVQAALQSSIQRRQPSCPWYSPWSGDWWSRSTSALVEVVPDRLPGGGEMLIAPHDDVEFVDRLAAKVLKPSTINNTLDPL